MQKHTAVLLIVGLALASCKKDDDTKPSGVATGGKTVFVVNEGNFLAGNSAITRFNKDTRAVDRDLFKAANPNVALGDVAQSMTINSGKGYIVVNNSNKVVVVDVATFKQQAEITGVAQPRYLITHNNYGFLTAWTGAFAGPGSVQVINLQTNQLTGSSVPTGLLPEELLLTPTGVMVANGGDSTLTVFNPDNLTAASTTITVAHGPTNLRLGNDGRVWVLCVGKAVYDSSPPYAQDTTASTAGTLISFPAANPTNQTRFTFPFRSFQPTNLRLSPDGSTLYYTYKGGLYQMSTSATALPTTPFIARDFYGLGIDPQDGTIYAADARNFTSDGLVRRYRPDGTFLDEFTTAIGPSRFAFY